MSEEKVLHEEGKKEDFTVAELIQRLMEDESWEKDPECRKKALGRLFMSVFSYC